jgi:hypothetical protein
VKLGYNEPLGAAKFVRYNQEFITTGIVYGFTHGFGTKKCVHYNREFVITEFVIAKFDCISKFNFFKYFIFGNFFQDGRLKMSLQTKKIFIDLHDVQVWLSFFFFFNIFFFFQRLLTSSTYSFSDKRCLYSWISSQKFKLNTV